MTSRVRCVLFVVPICLWSSRNEDIFTAFFCAFFFVFITQDGKWIQIDVSCVSRAKARIPYGRLSPSVISQQAQDVENDVVMMSMRRDDVASTSVWRHYEVMCLMGYYRRIFVSGVDRNDNSQILFTYLTTSYAQSSQNFSVRCLSQILLGSREKKTFTSRLFA